MLLYLVGLAVVVLIGVVLLKVALRALGYKPRDPSVLGALNDQKAHEQWRTDIFKEATTIKEQRQTAGFQFLINEIEAVNEQLAKDGDARRILYAETPNGIVISVSSAPSIAVAKLELVNGTFSGSCLDPVIGSKLPISMFTSQDDIKQRVGAALGQALYRSSRN